MKVWEQWKERAEKAEAKAKANMERAVKAEEKLKPLQSKVEKLERSLVIIRRRVLEKASMTKASLESAAFNASEIESAIEKNFPAYMADCLTRRETSNPKCGNNGTSWQRTNCEYDETGICIHCKEGVPF